MSEFRFAEPQLVHLLWGVVALVVALVWLDRRGGGALDRWMAVILQGRLVERPSALRRGLRIGLLGLAAVAMVLALMRPQWGLRMVATPRVGAEIMVALDVSRSMLAEDVAPNRLERAKAEISDLLRYLDGDQVGLIAFAGRASVLAPLTPDFGFLRLVLDGMGPGSVTRGGTRLAEPIRKAVAGFGRAEGASRTLLLITDGEDHDSFALDAAKEAAEAGIRIIAIGFGDELGSEIPIRDPRTGARGVVRDADGRPVRSRLDGDLLREIALATGGAYVPAGTGVLDLESIYDRHIARLTRGQLDPRGRAVREEGYAWFVLLALVLLVSSAAASAGVGAGRPAHAAAALGLAFAAASAPAARAQAPPEATAPLVAPEPGVPDAGAEAPPVPARERYNRGVAALDERDLDTAERWLEEARRDARDDDTLRFHAAYDLGWLSAQRAGRLRGEDPQAALQQLQRAADWFREAIVVRPDDEGARHNLEVVLERMLVLSDELAREAEGGLRERLEALAQGQRERIAAAAALHERSLASEQDPHAADRYRAEFRAEATAQRAVLAEADELAARVRDEVDVLQAKAEEERTPQDAMRSTQLETLGHFLHRARERMGQARRQLRRRQGERAYRRASAALGELKRAIDQLDPPAVLLDRLSRDGREVAIGTARLALGGRRLPGPDGSSDVLPPPPPWLTAAGLAEDQRSVAARTDELDERLLVGITQAEQAEADALPPEQVRMLARAAEAQPFVARARDAFGGAEAALQREELEQAANAQRDGLMALAEARERFLELEGLIEAAHAEQRPVVEVLGARADPDAFAAREEVLPALRDSAGRNLERVGRIGAALAERRAGLEAAAEAPPQEGAPPPDPEELEARRQRLDLAEQLLAVTGGALESLGGALGEADAPADGVRWEEARVGADQAFEALTALRRLFFTIVQLIRELAQDQLDVSDATRDAGALDVGRDPASDLPTGAEPLVPRQRELGERALALANGLEQQSALAAEQAADGGAADPDPAAPAPEVEGPDPAEQLRLAAEHVLRAEEAMGEAVRELEAPAWEETLAAQATAIEELKAALALLVPPEQRQPPQQGDSQQQQQPQPQPEGGEEGAEQEPQQSPAGGDADAAEPEERAGQQVVDPGQMLQEVRDREAQRRRERAQRRSGYERVERDW